MLAGIVNVAVLLVRHDLPSVSGRATDAGPVTPVAPRTTVAARARAPAIRTTPAGQYGVHAEVQQCRRSVTLSGRLGCRLL